MPPEAVDRTIQLKAVHFSAGRRKTFHPPQIHDVLAQAWRDAGTAADLLFPGIDGENRSKRQCFMNAGVSRDRGFTFQFCSYLPDEIPPSMDLNLATKEVDIAPVPFQDGQGQRRQVVHVAHVLAYGGVLIVEVAKGSGGLGMLQRYLAYLIRRQLGDKHPIPHLYDAVTSNLASAIQRGGGVVEVDLALVQPNVRDGSVYADTLTDLQSQLPGTDKVVVSWKSNTQLRRREVEDIFEEAEANDALDRIKIVLQSGEEIGLKKHRIRKPISVQAAQGRHPISNEVIRAMRQYLIELMNVQADGTTVLTEDGRLADAFMGR